MLPGGEHVPRKPTTPHTFRPQLKPSHAPPLRGTTLNTARSKIKVTPDKNPETWHPEVIRALSSRLPGGVSQVTLPCKNCNSVFYPCLCEDESRNVPHSRGLVPPKVVKEAEFRRLTRKAMGHLDELQKTLDTKGIIKDVCQIIDSEETSMKLALQTSERSSVTRNILWRDCDTYVVTDGNADCITKVLQFTGEELQELSEIVAEESWRFAGAEKRNASVLTIRTGVEHGAFVKTVEVVYRNRQEAEGDVQLREFVNSKQEIDWEVAAVKKNGIADEVEICLGLRLLQLEFATSYDKDLSPETCWKKFDLADGGQPPCCLMIPEQQWEETEQAARVFVPCKLTFTWLVPGAQVKKDGVPLTTDSLQELLDMTEGNEEVTTLELEWSAKERIDREETILRHCHFIEQEQQEQDESTSLIDRRREDMELFHEWIVKHKMSPFSLIYVFSKLIDSVKSEMTAFEKNKKERRQMLLSKAIRAADIQATLEDLKTVEEEQRNQKFIQLKEKEFAMARRQLKGMLDQVPLYFIEEEILNKGEDDELEGQSASPTQKLLHTKTTELEAKKAMATQRRSHAKFQTQTSSISAADADSTARVTLGADRMARHIETLKAKAAWHFLKQEAMHYRASLKDRDHGSSKLKSRAKVGITLPAMDMCQEEDGRLSKKEFEKILMMAGVNWLSREECEKLFENMDQDNSGKLNLGELLHYANRVTSVVRRMQAFEQNRNRDRAIALTRQELLHDFGMSLRMGKDLVGTKMRPMVADDKITASSYFLGRASHGLKEMWRSRLDWEDGSCWVGNPQHKDPNPFIQWEFPGERTVTAVATKGRPDTASWVEKFRLEYSEYPSDDVPPGVEEWKRYKDVSLFREEILVDKFRKPVGQKRASLIQALDAPDEPVEEVGHGTWIPVYSLEGNVDQNTQKDNILEHPFQAVRVRIYPMGYEGRCPAMRAAIFGCITRPKLT